jgi:hypothetical protein
MFKIGDRVWSLVSGWGYVISLCGMVKDFPIVVMFDGGNTESFTEDGKDGCDNPQPILYHNECEITPFVTKTVLGKVIESKPYTKWDWSHELKVITLEPGDMSACIPVNTVVNITYQSHW